MEGIVLAFQRELKIKSCIPLEDTQELQKKTTTSTPRQRVLEVLIQCGSVSSSNNLATLSTHATYYFFTTWVENKYYGRLWPIFPESGWGSFWFRGSAETI